MKDDIQDVYLDESGTTGNDLLNAEQPYFTYAAVALSESDAEDIVEKIRKKFALNQGQELKFKNISRKKNIEPIVEYIITELKGKCAVVCFEKLYSLCCKFVEAIFEPCVSNKNSLIYLSGLHHFLAYSIYWQYTYNNTYIKDCINDFANLMTNKNTQNIDDFLLKYSSGWENIEELDANIGDFFKIIIGTNFDKIKEDIELSIGDNQIDKYSLDLSVTALVSLCSCMSSKHKNGINVIYDDTNIINAQLASVNAFATGYFKIPNLNFLTEEKYNEFNIKNKLKNENSKSSFAIQLADLVSGMTNYAFKNNKKNIIHNLVKNKILVSCVSSIIHINGPIEFFEVCYFSLIRKIVLNMLNKKRVIITRGIEKDLLLLHEASSYMINLYI